MALGHDAVFIHRSRQVLHMNASPCLDHPSGKPRTREGESHDQRHETCHGKTLLPAPL